MRASGQGRLAVWAGTQGLSLVFAMLLGAQSIDGCDVHAVAALAGRCADELVARVRAAVATGPILRAEAD